VTFSFHCYSEADLGKIWEIRRRISWRQMKSISTGNGWWVDMPYITAQRVRSQKTGREAIHAFLHESGHLDWSQSPEALFRSIDQDAGVLIDKKVSPILQGGNEVLSYLDILAPEGTPRSVMIEILDAFYGVEARPGPLVLIAEGVMARVSVRRDRLENWRAEIEDLSRAIEDLLRKATRLRAGRPSSKAS